MALKRLIRGLLRDPGATRDPLTWIILNEVKLPTLYRWAASQTRFRTLPASSPVRGIAQWRSLAPGEEPQLPVQLMTPPGSPELRAPELQAPASIWLRPGHVESGIDWRLVLTHELGHLLGLEDIYAGKYKAPHFMQPFEHQQALQRLVRKRMTPRSVDLLRAQITAPINPQRATDLAGRVLKDPYFDPLGITTSLAYQEMPYEVVYAWNNIRHLLPDIRAGQYSSLEPVIPLTERIMSEVYEGASPPRLASLMREEVPISPGMSLTARRALPFAARILEQMEEPGLARQAGRVGTWLWNVGQFARLAGEVVPSIVAPIAAGALAQQAYKHFIRPRLVSREEA